MFTLQPSARLRPSPFYASAMADGMTAGTIYNRMVLPTGFGDPEAEYWRLVEGVSMWDVGCERQVELRGPDATRLAQVLTPRRLDRCAVGQGKYAPLCDHEGVLLNDPILMKLDEDHYWLSIADSDMRLWAAAIAAERGLDVTVTEPDVSPLAVQGPKSDDVIAAICGDWARELKYFWFKETEIEGIPVVLCRSGWSKQSGFELFLRDGARGADLWNIVKEAGRPYDIGPGGPSTAERVESGLVSLGGDTDPSTNPFEVRLGRFVDLDAPDDVIGIAALRRIAREGPRRRQLGARLESGEPKSFDFGWIEIERDGRLVGHLTNCVWSPRLQANIGFALVEAACEPGDEVRVRQRDGAVAARLEELPFP